jgi:phosphoglucomutase
MADLHEALSRAVEEGRLLAASCANVWRLLSANNPLYRAAVEELVEGGCWTELNDRFFKTLTFGTGGLRGRTIGKVITRAERGSQVPALCPEFPCVGTNAMNFYNVSRATQGLVSYAAEYASQWQGRTKPSIVIAHDTRHFSRGFAELTARVAMENGCDVFLFEDARSTPELSFAVRCTNSTAGVVITASHNPPHDNGYKVYFADGAQVVEPHASGIIEKVNQIAGELYEPLPPARLGRLTKLGSEMDEAYRIRLRTLVLRPGVVASQTDLKVVFTAIHGTGGIISVPALKDLGFQVQTVKEQDSPNGAFPTVKSPNPENADALAMGIALAEKEDGDLVIGTDPDSDRMGVAVRDATGKMKLLTGNQIGSLLAYYRIKALKDQHILDESNVGRGVIVKTLVTTDLQKTIAEREGLHCVETLTGFKYVGEKLGRYEAALPDEVRKIYRTLSEAETRAARLQHSYFFVFGGEESYGYSGADFVRDKDANGGAIMFAEVAAYAKSLGLTIDQLLDQIYLQYGCYLEKNGFLAFEGAAGAEQIRRLAESYKSKPPVEIDGSKVVSVEDFAAGGIKDAEGAALPKEKMTIFQLADGRRIAVRPSGTEPKIKFYMFGVEADVRADNLPEVKSSLAATLDRLWGWVQEDVKRRLGHLG